MQAASLELVDQGDFCAVRVRNAHYQIVGEIPIPARAAKVMEVTARLPQRLKRFVEAVNVTEAKIPPQRGALADDRLHRAISGLVDELIQDGTPKQRRNSSAAGFFNDVRSALGWAVPPGQRGGGPLIRIAFDPRRAGFNLPFEIMPIGDQVSRDSDLRLRLRRYPAAWAIVARGATDTATPAPRSTAPLSFAGLPGTPQRNSLPLAGIASQWRLFAQQNMRLNPQSYWPRDRDQSLDPEVELARLIYRALLPRDADGGIGILHFACHHGEESGEAMLDFGLDQAGGRIRCSVADLRGALAVEPETRASAGALAFVNACDTNALSDRGDALLLLLTSHAVRSIVGSEAPLPDTLAGAYASNFYTAILRGETVGAATLHARDRLIAVNNLGGMLYTLYGDAGLQPIDASLQVGPQA